MQEQINRVANICAKIILDNYLFGIGEIIKKYYVDIPQLHEHVLVTNAGLGYVSKMKYEAYWALFEVDISNGSILRKSLIKAILSEYLPPRPDVHQIKDWNNLDFSKYPDAVNFIG